MEAVIRDALREMDEALRTVDEAVRQAVAAARQAGSGRDEGGAGGGGSALDYAQGMSLLSLKCDSLLAYLHHLVALMAFKVEQVEQHVVAGGSTRIVDRNTDTALSVASLRDHPVVEHLIRHRLVLDKIRPMEKKLGDMIDGLLRREGQAEPRQEGEKASRPRLEDFLGTDSDDDSDGKSEKEAERADKPSPPLDEMEPSVYRPPKSLAMPYTRSKEPSRARRSRMVPAAMQDDLDADSLAPVPLSSSGTGLTRPSMGRGQGGQSDAGAASRSGQGGSKLARELAQLEKYEEENFVRVSYGKKAMKRRRRAEEDVAFGFEGAGRGKVGRGQGGGFDAEFGDLLQDRALPRIKAGKGQGSGRGDQGRRGGGGGGGGDDDVYDALRQSDRVHRKAAAQSQAQSAFEPRSRGVSGIMARHREQSRKRSRD